MAAYRYHRLRMTDVGYYTSYPLVWSAWEIKFYTGSSQTGTEFASLGTAFASSADTGYEANKANDGNNTTRWSSPGTSLTMKIWGVDSGSGNSYAMASLSITAYADGGGTTTPKKFVVEGSDDNSTWAIVSTEISTTNTTTDKTTMNFDVISPVTGGFPLLGGGMIR